VPPTRSQIATTREVVRWYLATHYGAAGDVGVIDTFADPARVGAFAVSKAAIESAESAQLFRLLVTVAMFQRLRDTHVMGILRRVVRRDDDGSPARDPGENPPSRCVVPAGASPASVGADAPSIRPQARIERSAARAGRRERG
jgi:hypothetical protein